MPLCFIQQIIVVVPMNKNDELFLILEQSFPTVFSPTEAVNFTSRHRVNFIIIIPAQLLSSSHIPDNKGVPFYSLFYDGVYYMKYFI